MMVNLAQGLVDDGVEVDLVLGRADGPYLAQVPQQVRLVDLNSSRILTGLPGLMRYLQENQPLALISALDHANLVALWAKRLTNVSSRIVLSLHATISEGRRSLPIFSKRRVLPHLIRRFYPWANGIVAVSKGVAEDYSQEMGIPLERFKVIYNPVVTESLYRKAQEPLVHPWFMPEEPPVFITIGRLSEEKDHALLIRAFARVKKVKAARLLVLGEGNMRAELEMLIRGLGLEDNVLLPGFVNNPYPYLARASLFVLSSRTEGLPTALIESLAVGTPVISTDCRSGPREILKNGKYGHLVPVGDECKLVEAMLNALSNNKSKKDMKKYAKCLEEFKPEFAVKSYLSIIKN